VRKNNLSSHTIPNRQQPAVKAAQDLALKAVYSRSLKSAKTLASEDSQVDLYSDDSEPGKGYQDLLERADIQAVIIALVQWNLDY